MNYRGSAAILSSMQVNAASLLESSMFIDLQAGQAKVVQKMERNQ
jgi:hypothetical protein